MIVLCATIFLYVISHCTSTIRGGSRPSARGAKLHNGDLGAEPQGQSPWSGGQRDFVPLKLKTFSYFRDYFLYKIIT